MLGRITRFTTLGVVFAACQPTVPDSGLDFDRNAAAARESQLTQSAIPAAAPVAQTALDAPVPQTATPSQAPLPASVLEAVNNTAEARARANAAQANSGSEPLQASPSNPTPVQLGNPGLSSEQDFGQVSGARSIETDAQRIAANRAQYEVITPTSLPTREGSQPNIVQYALRTNNPVGAQIYNRGRARPDRTRAACAQYASPDLAQTAFLSEGGPQRDRNKLDPDGDGYACGWDPAPFRNIGRPTSAVIEPLAISTE